MRTNVNLITAILLVSSDQALAWCAYKRTAESNCVTKCKGGLVWQSAACYGQCMQGYQGHICPPKPKLGENVGTNQPPKNPGGKTAPPKLPTGTLTPTSTMGGRNAPGGSGPSGSSSRK
jgi:hypothetical protein